MEVKPIHVMVRSCKSTGQLFTSTGDLVGVTIPPGATDVKIDKDGAVTAVLSGRKSPYRSAI
jgi:flagellar basal body rod protein FlgF